jgi:S-(hydroxymethyl)glutathione dehydrogenase / alcohol dehydrogenase
VKAAVLQQVGDERLDVRDDVVTTAVGAGKVRVRIKATGVCHSDLSAMNGTIPVAVPAVLGHEGAGEVVEVGAGVTGLVEGDHVVVCWSPQCGACRECINGQHQLCMAYMINAFSDAHFQIGTTPVFGMAGAGTFAEELILLEQGAIKIDKDVPYDVASLLGCGVMTGVGAAVNAAKVEPGSSVVVFGCGGVGISVIQGARIAGAAVIVAVDVAEARLDTARRFGATHTVRATRGDDEMRDVVAAVRGIAGARGADYAFECTAVPALGAAPLRMIRHGGTAVQVSGIEQVIPVDMELFEFDKTYVNPLYGNCRPSVDFPRLLELHRRGDLLLDELVTRTYALDDLDAAFDDLLAGRNAKGVIVLSDVA